jgi:hypothetical protein
MVRRMAAVVLALALNPLPLRAQDAALTITVASADVHKGPSTVTPVIGHVSGGRVLPVVRNLGSWVRIDWPGVPDGVGYVHVTMGRLGPSTGDASSKSLPSMPAPTAASAPAAAPMPPANRRPVERMAVRGDIDDPPVTHIFGVGGVVASRSSFGAAARAWRTDHLGLQLAVSRDTTTSDVDAGRVRSVRVEPGVVYALFDRVTDYVWFRPYVGSAISFNHQTLTHTAPAAIASASDNGIGVRVFGGSELTFAGAPRFGLSAEVGYRRFPAPFPAFEAKRLSASIAGHWYIK